MPQWHPQVSACLPLFFLIQVFHIPRLLMYWARGTERNAVTPIPTVTVRQKLVLEGQFRSQGDASNSTVLATLQRALGLVLTDKHQRKQECMQACLFGKGMNIPVFHPEGQEWIFFIACDLCYLQGETTPESPYYYVYPGLFSLGLYAGRLFLSQQYPFLGEAGTLQCEDLSAICMVENSPDLLWVLKLQNQSFWQRSHVLCKGFDVVVPYALLCIWDRDNCQHEFPPPPKIVLYLNAEKINCPVSDSRSLNQHQLTKSR